MLMDPKDREMLLMVLRAFIEEWGAEFVSLWLPESWKRYGHYRGPILVEYRTERSICVRVNCDSVQISYELQFLPQSSDAGVSDLANDTTIEI